MSEVGDIVECEFCGNLHKVIGHMGGMAMMACSAIPQGEIGISQEEAS